MESPASQYEFLTRPLVDSWVGMLRRAGESKKEFNDAAEMCESFYKKSSGFMWADTFKAKYIGADVPTPRYNVTVNTAFEYVSRFGPRLYWQNPRRRVTRPARPQLDAEQFMTGDPMQDQFLATAMQEQQLYEARTQVANSLWETYLNYTPSETPGGGLEAHSRLAIDEALVTGRGILMPRSYLPPGGDRRITGCFHVPNADLLIDPDCSSPLLMDAKWIALRHVSPYWELEQRFGWPRGSLRNKGQFESGASQGSRRTQLPFEKDADVPKDLMVWYEIWSKAGCGARFVTTPLQNKDEWDDLCGDYCYLCITPNVKSPLNLPAWWLTEATEDELRERIEWPVPYWKDGRWPITLLDFYHNSVGPWPLAPLSAALGEMICLQILLALYLQNAEANCQQIVAYLDSAASQVEQSLRSGKSPAFVKLSDGTQKSINELVQFLNRPNQNTDVLEAMQFLMTQIERKTGLSALLYGENPGGAVSRSAADIQAKTSNVTLIPDFMAKRVAAFQGDVADKERIAAYYAGVSGQDVEPLMGPLGAKMWDQFIAAEDEEIVLRGMRARVEASDMRKPDKAKDSENLQTLSSYVVPALMQYGQMTGSFEPWNGFVDAIANAMEIDTEGFKIPSGPSPEQQLQQGNAEQEQARMEMESQQADAEQQRKAQEMEMKLSMQREQMDLKRQQAESALQMKAAEHDMRMQQSDEQFQQKIDLNQLMAAERLRQSRQQAKSQQGSAKT